jgi:hypothetical protein
VLSRTTSLPIFIPLGEREFMKSSLKQRHCIAELLFVPHKNMLLLPLKAAFADG